MKTKPNIWFIGGALVSALLIAGSAVLLVMSVRQTAAVEKQLTRKREDLKRIYRRDPFPSEENVQRQQANITEMREWFAKLVGEAAKGQLAAEERSPSIFMSVLGQTQRQLTADAAKQADRLPPQFAFGFGRYFGESSKLPSPEHVPRLTQQLRITESLCRVLYAENVPKIVAIHRELFEGGVALESEGPLVNPEAGLMGVGALYGRLRFALEFDARESTIIAVLNRLARHELFIVVTQVEFRKLAEDVRVAQRPPPPPVPEPGQPPPPLPELLTRQQRLISGLAIEQPMRVRIVLDVYQFSEVAP